MFLRATVLAGVLAAAVAAPGTAVAATGWQLTYLPVPDGYEDAAFSVNTTAGHGDHAGQASFGADGTTELVVWSRGGVTVVHNPGGCTDVQPVDENPSALVAVSAIGCPGTADARAYTYDNRGFHRLPAPAGYHSTTAIAVNASGDVLGRATAEGKPDTTVLWPHGAATPKLIADTMDQQVPVDLDDDGTVLFTFSHGSAILRGGTLTPLSVPAGFTETQAYAIRHGVVVGNGAGGEHGFIAAYWWPTPTTPKALPGGTYAVSVNSSGLVAGDLMTWRQGKSAGVLPIEGDYGAAVAVGDDGTVVGEVYADIAKPVLWVNASRR